MPSKLFISPDLGTRSSGNIVSSHEFEFLNSLPKEHVTDKVFKIGYNEINPIKYSLPDNPFLQDYLAMNYIANMGLEKNEVDIAHFYAGTFSNTIRYLNEKGINTTLTIDAHSREESIKEFENLGYKYPFYHVSDDRLWEIYNAAVTEAKVVITPSTLSADILKNEGVDSTRIKTIPHGIDIPSTHERCNTNNNINNNINNNTNNNKSNEFRVGYIGGYGPDKGIKYLIQAWSSLNYTDKNVKLMLAGRESEKLEPFIRKYADGGNFQLLGYIENLYEFYNACSIYVQPSVTEAWGMEVTEAMAHGCPVIVADGCGAKDMVKDEVNGYVVPKRDPKAIADKIDSFRNEPEDVKQMFTTNAILKSKEYSWEEIRKKYTEIWESL